MKNKYVMPLISIAFILLLSLIITTSYAYYTANVNGNDEAYNTVITSGYMALRLNDGAEVTANNLGLGESVTKTFSVTNTGTVATDYSIYFSKLINTFVDKNDLVYTLQTSNGCSKAETIVPTLTQDSAIVQSCNINPGVTHEYTLLITYKNDDSNQDDNKGRRFSASISINEYEDVEHIALLDEGLIVNRKIKELVDLKTTAEGEEYYQANGDYLDTIGATILNAENTKEKITSLTFTNEMPSDNVRKVNISSPDSYYDIIAYMDGTNLYIATNQDIIYTNKNSQLLFDGISNIETLDLTMLDTSKTTDMSMMFTDLKYLTRLILGPRFNTHNVISFYGLFNSTERLSDMSFLSQFDTSNAENMSGMFLAMESVQTLDLSSFDTSKVTSMEGMFFNMSNLTSLNLSSFNTSNVEKMRSMFNKAKSLTSLDLSSFDTRKVTTMNKMFKDMYNLQSLNLGNNFDTSNVTNMHEMFSYSRKLRVLDLGPKFDVSKVQDGSDMFRSPDGVITTIYSPRDLVYASGSNINNMFLSTRTIVGGKGTVYSSQHEHGDYAVIDCGTKRPGYLSFRGTEEEYEAFCSKFN